MNTLHGAPISPDQIAAFEAEADIRFPQAYVQGMLERNGGIIRIRRTEWYLLPIPPGELPGNPLMWWGKGYKDIAQLIRKYCSFKGVHPRAIPIAIRLNVDGPGPLLMLCPRQSKWSVYTWDFGDELSSAGELRRQPVLADIANLWKDTPGKIPPRQCKWKVKARKLEDSAYLQHCKEKAPRNKRTDTARSAWLEAGNITLTTGKIALADGFSYPGYAEPEVTLPVGSYGLFLQTVRYGEDRRIAALRLLAATEAPSSDPEYIEIAEVTIDTAIIAICERPPLESIDPEEHEEVMMDASEYEIYDRPDMKRYDLALFEFGGTVTAACSTGFGDGCYTAYELKKENATIGLQVNFIAPDEAHPILD